MLRRGRHERTRVALRWVGLVAGVGGGVETVGAVVVDEYRLVVVEDVVLAAGLGCQQLFYCSDRTRE